MLSRSLLTDGPLSCLLDTSDICLLSYCCWLFLIFFFFNLIVDCLCVQHLAENRQLAGRPEAVDQLSWQQVLDEKLAVQRALLYVESIHGRPASLRHKDLLRPLYDRYRSLKVSTLGGGGTFGLCNLFNLSFVYVYFGFFFLANGRTFWSFSFQRRCFRACTDFGARGAGDSKSESRWCRLAASFGSTDSVTRVGWCDGAILHGQEELESFCERRRIGEWPVDSWPVESRSWRQRPSPVEEAEDNIEYWREFTRSACVS